MSEYNLKRVMKYVLGSILLVQIVFGIWLFFLFSYQKSLARAINIAGRQRML